MAAVTDIADTALKWLVRRDWKGIEGIPVHGPEDLSYGQAAVVIERILKRPVQYRQAPANDYVRAMIRSGASAGGYARCPLELFGELAQDIARAEPRRAESTTQTTLAAWAETELLPAIESLRPRSETAAGPLHSLNSLAHPNGNQDCDRLEYETQSNDPAEMSGNATRCARGAIWSQNLRCHQKTMRG
jgi:hypothetical protein